MIRRTYPWKNRRPHGPPARRLAEARKLSRDWYGYTSFYPNGDGEVLGDKKLAVFDEEEAQKWVVGVGVYRLMSFEHPRRMCNFPVIVRTGSFPL